RHTPSSTRFPYTTLFRSLQVTGDADMNSLDSKINTHFPGLVVRKDLVKTVKGNAIVPSYVLEYLLGQYCATSDEATIQTGIETVDRKSTRLNSSHVKISY